jgi:hypothetical protein
MEYRMTSLPKGKTITADTGAGPSTGDYMGTPAVCLRIATTISRGMIFPCDLCYGTTMKGIPVGTVTMTINGQITTRDLPATRRLICKIHPEYRYSVHLKTQSTGAPEP